MADQQMEKYLVNEELEHYRFGWISRREFIRRAALIGVGAATASALVKTVKPSPVAATAQQTSPFSVEENDPRVGSETIWYNAADGTPIMAYMAWPANAPMDKSLPAVAISHANRGLLPHVKDVARRFAVQGYVAIAPDQVTRVGPPALELADEDARRAAYASLNSAQTARDMVDAVEILKAHPAVNAAKLAATGYCAGGGITWRMSTLVPELRAAAPFYGSNPPEDAVPNIRAAMLGVYGELDRNLNAGIPRIEELMKSAGTTYEVRVYPESLHAFHDDSGQAYNPTTAPEAWRDTLNWFARYLELPQPQV